MAVFNLGSINVDHFYRVPHLPVPGETLPAREYRTGLGGKGANQSVAVARAGSRAVHIGTIGPDAAWTIERLRGFGVDVSQIASIEAPTGHAIIYVDDRGENSIVTFAGANRVQNLKRIKSAMAKAGEGDILLVQNEVSHKAETAKFARDRGMFVVYSAAPFDADVVAGMLPHVDLLVVNEVEAEQLSDTMGVSPAGIAVPHLLITRGTKGSVWRDQMNGRELFAPAFAVDAVDTTGAGDCFIGYTAAGMDQGMCAEESMRLGAAAAALKVTRPGTADAMPSRDEVDAFLAGRVSK
jgi:ribokinase